MINLIAISDARNNLPSLINRVNQTLDRFFITINGQPKAAVLSIEELESIEETAEILAIPGARASIKRSIHEAKSGKLIPWKSITPGFLNRKSAKSTKN